MLVWSICRYKDSVNLPTREINKERVQDCVARNKQLNYYTDLSTSRPAGGPKKSGVRLPHHKHATTHHASCTKSAAGGGWLTNTRNDSKNRSTLLDYTVYWSPPSTPQTHHHTPHTHTSFAPKTLPSYNSSCLCSPTHDPSPDATCTAPRRA